VKKTLLLVVAVVLAGSATVRAEDRVVELLKSDLRAERAAVVKEEMRFTEEEAAAFWPVYKRYEDEIRKINEQRLELNRKYAEGHASMTDDLAEQMAKKSLELDVKEANVRKHYFRKFKHVLPATRAAKFFQLDSLMSLLVRTQIAAEPPFIE
jgi:CRISPR/Cas system-associated endonuclease Cas1